MKRSKFFNWMLLLILLATSPVIADDFVLRDMAGRTHRLADYRGQWLLVNFWATWCPPCLEEVPDLIALDEQRPDVSVIGIATDADNPAGIRRFVDDNLMSYPVVLGDADVVRQFGRMRVIPSTYIYDPRGQLVKIHRGLLTQQAIERLIAPSPETIIK